MTNDNPTENVTAGASGTRFVPRSVERSGGFTLSMPPDVAFPYFSPIGEKVWAPGWDPELLHPPGVDWAPGLLFRTRSEHGDAIWVVTALNPERHEVEYHKLEAERSVTKVSVQCTPLGPDQTEVRVTYFLVALSEAGNQLIAEMTPASYEGRMKNWQRWIHESRSQAR
jgi:hypothetical protein